ncbi:MAG: hypothetical protein AB1505_36520 [Candidatus Latescibacterota bacterium]
MATGGPDAFLRTEEEANRLVDELTRLKEETEAYSTARGALDHAAQGLSDLAGRMGGIAVQLRDVAGTLRSIGTPELRRGQEALTGEVAMLRQDLGRSIGALSDDVRAQLAGARAELRTLRHLALVGLALLVTALALLGWLALSVPRS